MLVTHLGLGDGFVQTGLTIALLPRCKELAFPCYEQYLPTFQSVFARYPEIKVFPVEQIHGEDWGSPRDLTFNRAIEQAGCSEWRQLRLGVYAGRGIGQDFTKTFYEQAGIPYEAKWRLCPILEASLDVPQFMPASANSARKIFLHDDPVRGFHIRRQYVAHGHVFSPPRDFSKSALVYAGYISEADEVHCIDSAFFWLADLLPSRGRLFLHKYARWQRSYAFRYETFRYWNYID